MFIAPRKEWSPETVRVLLPFCERPLVPEPPASDLDDRIRGALFGLGRKVSRATAVSLGAIQKAVDGLPLAARKNAQQGFVAGFQIAQEATLDELLQFVLGDAMRAAGRPPFGRYVDVTTPITARMTRDLGDVATTGLRLSVMTAIEFHAGFADMGRGDLAAKVEPFTRLYREGNYPMGPLRDGTFLVLTA